MTDKEKIALSIAGSLATIAIGYLIWRHEEAVHAANDEAQVAANAQIAQDQNAALEQYLTAIPGFAQVSPTDTSAENFGSTSTATSPVDPNIAAILQAFYPSTGTAQPTATPTTNNQTTPGPVSTTPIPPVIKGLSPNPVKVSNLPSQL